MGYTSRLTGNLEFSAPVSSDLLYRLRESSEFSCLSYGGRFESDGWFDDGESGKMYDLEEEAALLVKAVNAEIVRVTGEIRVDGEDNTDIWRLVFTGTDVRVERPEIRWPDGTVVESRY